MNVETVLTRREMVELALRAAAVPGAALFFSTWLNAAQVHNHQSGTTPPPQPKLLRDYQPRFFSPEDFQALQAFTEILIPTDDTPGAREAYCAHYIDFVLQASSETPQTQTAWRNALAALKRTGFYTAEANRRLQLVSEMARPETDPTAQHPGFSAYRLIKQQTAFAFYTSRQGMIEALDYRGNSYNLVFPACNHPEHQRV
jgi:gluconate 2-dehydrogenase gamma chain